MSLHSRKPQQQVARLPLTQTERLPIRPGDWVIEHRRARPRRVKSVHGIIDSPDGGLRWEVEFADDQIRAACVIDRHATPEEVQHFGRMA